MELTNQKITILKRGLESEYIPVTPEEYADSEYLHKWGCLELGFVVPGTRYYWLTTLGRKTIGG
jgi:hypothetical protein